MNRTNFTVGTLGILFTTPFFSPLFAEDETVERRFPETLKIFEEIESSPSIVLCVRGPQLINWDAVRFSEYEKTYSKISTPEFLSQFSMKRNYTLEPFFPLLFPKSGDFSQLLDDDGKDVLKQICDAKRDVNQTLYEIHKEQFLIPFRGRAFEMKIRSEYEIDALNYVPISYILSEALLFHHVAAGESCSANFAASIARQGGMLEYRCGDEMRTILKDAPDSVILVLETETCEFLKKSTNSSDIAVESQLETATVTIFEAAPTQLGIGSAAYTTLFLSAPRETYSVQTQKFIERFESMNGRVRAFEPVK